MDLRWAEWICMGMARAALERTKMDFGTVCAPGQRYHPAIIAQAAATLCQMYPERFWLALGSGQNLNEHITGDAWPEKHLRQQRLRECVDIMRRLWAGRTVSHDGLVKVVDAKLTRFLKSHRFCLARRSLTKQQNGWEAGRMGF